MFKHYGSDSSLGLYTYLDFTYSWYIYDMHIHLYIYIFLKCVYTCIHTHMYVLLLFWKTFLKFWIIKSKKKVSRPHFLSLSFFFLFTFFLSSLIFKMRPSNPYTRGKPQYPRNQRLHQRERVRMTLFLLLKISCWSTLPLPLPPPRPLDQPTLLTPLSNASLMIFRWDIL